MHIKASYKGKTEPFPGTGIALILHVALLCRMSSSVLTNEAYSTQTFLVLELPEHLRSEVRF